MMLRRAVFLESVATTVHGAWAVSVSASMRSRATL